MKISKEQNGAVLLIVSVVLGIIIICILFSVDVGRYYIVTARLQNITDASVEAAASVINDEVKRIAEENSKQFEIPPTNDSRFYLTDEDRKNILFGHTLSQVKTVMVNTAEHNFLNNPELKKSTKLRNLYPVNVTSLSCESSQDSKAIIRSEAESQLPIVFAPLAKILGKKEVVATSESVSVVDLCFRPGFAINS